MSDRSCHGCLHVFEASQLAPASGGRLLCARCRRDEVNEATPREAPQEGGDA